MFNIKFITIIFLFFLNFDGFVLKHPLHVSTTELNYTSNDKSLEVSCKIFTDDFEDILNKTYRQNIDLSKSELKSAMNVLVQKYINNHLKIKIDGKPVSLNYLGFEIDHEVTNVYLEVENLQAIKQVEIENRILYDLFDDQMSIIHIIKNSVRKSGKLLYPDRLFSTKF